MISKEIQKKLVTGVILSVIIIATCVMCFTIPMGLSSNLNVKNDLIGKTLSQMSDEQSDDNGNVSTRKSFGRFEEEMKTSNGLYYNIDLDARDSAFCDDILITFKVLNGSNVSFWIKVTFYFSDWSGGSKGEEWSITASNGNRLMNSGKYQVYTMACNWSVTYNGVTTTEQVVFNK